MTIDEKKQGIRDLIEYSKKYELLIEAIKQAGDDPLRNWSQYADKIDELWEAQTHE